jgi:hypothetical protein
MTDSASEQQNDPEAPTPPARQINRTLLAESSLYGVPYAAYSDMSPRERGAVKGRWALKIRQEAKRRNIDPDEFLAMSEDAREEARNNFPEHVPPRGPTPRAVAKTFEEVARKHSRVEDDEPVYEEPVRPKRAPVAQMYDEGLAEGEPDTHSPMDDVPPTEFDPKMRASATIGEVRPVDNEDLVGWKQPRNLRDVYARFTIGDGQHFVRVERIDPKVWQQVPCSGYLGEIREPISEPEFHAWYGGRVYALTVYGPDPKGRRDPSTGLPVIKAKTEPFRYTVPLLPPNLAAPPGASPTKQGDMQMNPFLTQQGHTPATPADAQMHKSTLDFFTGMLARGEQERDQLRRTVLEGGGSTKEVLGIVSETSNKALEAAQRAAEQRENVLRDQIRESKEDNRRLSEKLDKLLEEKQQGRANPVQDAVSLMQTVNPSKNSEEEVKRLREAHVEEMTRVREGHREAMVALKDRQDDELKRLRERLDDVEKQGRARMDEAERRWRDREKELRDQMELQRRDERDAADRRVQENTARFEDRIKDMREQHGRELRMQSEQHTTRVDTTKGTWEMQLSNAKERITRLEAELEEAQAEAERSKDPVQVIEKVTAQAEALGFSKTDENANQTAGERFIGTVGMGLSKALETMNEWLPRAMAARAATPELPPGAQGAPRALPQGQGMAPGMAQQQRIVRPQNRRAVAWATEGSVPIAGQRPVIPPEVTAPPVQAQPMAPQPFQPASVQAQPSPPAPVPQPVQEMPQPMPAQEQAPAPTNGQSRNTMGAIFPDSAIVEFRAEVERAINAGLPADVFASRFVQAFPEQTMMLVQAHKPEELGEIVKAMPGGGASVILRRDGRRWVEQLWQQIIAQHQARAGQPQQQGAQA